MRVLPLSFVGVWRGVDDLVPWDLSVNDLVPWDLSVDIEYDRDFCADLCVD